MLKLRVLLPGLVVVAVSLVVILGAPGRQAGVESHYHYRMGARIAAGDLAPSPGDHLPWGALGTEHPVDHHWGLHAMIAPAAAIGKLLGAPEVGMKLAAILFALLAVYGSYGVLRWAGAPWAELLAVAPLAFGWIPWRMMQLRGGSVVSAGLLIWGWALFGKARPLLAGLLAYALMLCYHGGFLAVPLALAGGGAVILARWDRPPRLPPAIRRGILGTVAGVLLGVTAGPYGAKALDFLAYHMATSFGDPRGYYGAGHEFSPFSLPMLAHFPEYGVATAALAALGLALWRGRRRLPDGVAALYGMSVALAVLSWRSHRLVEYAVPFAAVALGAWLGARRGGRRLPRWIQASFAVLLLGGVALQTARTVEVVRASSPTAAYAGAREIFREHPGVIVNLYEGDFSLILWSYPEARCAKGLSHYFTDHDPAVSGALGVLRRGAADVRMARAVDLLVAKGGSVFTQRPFLPSGQARPFVAFASRHPDLLRLAWRAPGDFAWAWLPLRPSAAPSAPPPPPD